MQRLIKSVLVFSFLAILLGLPGSKEINAQGPLTEILNRMENHRVWLEDLKANITMTKTDTLLNETDVSTGVVSFIPAKKDSKEYLRLAWITPVKQLMIVSNGEYLLYKPGIKQATVGSVKSIKKQDKAKDVFGFLGMSRNELKSNFNRQFLGSSNDIAHLRLIPKGKSNYKKVELWVNHQGTVIRAEVVEVGNNRTLVELSNIFENSNLNKKIFDIKEAIPKGTNIIRG